jgi:SM-20-related protein
MVHPSLAVFSIFRLEVCSYNGEEVPRGPMLESLKNVGWRVEREWLSHQDLSRVAAAFRLWKAENRFTPARIGQGGNLQQHGGIRGDETWWFDVQAPPAELLPILRRVDELKTEINRALYLGLKDWEVHLASYAPGAGYKKHLDRHQQQSSRKLSLVLYLNESWQKADGGELVIYNHEGTEVTRFAPEGGTLVLFLSEDFPHEVLPAKRERHSLTGWFLDAPRGVV